MLFHYMCIKYNREKYNDLYYYNYKYKFIFVDSMCFVLNDQVSLREII